MKGRIALPLLLILLCCALAGVPAVAQVLFSSEPHVDGSSAGGVKIGPGPFTAPNIQAAYDVSWNCAFTDCDVEGVSFWVFNGRTGGQLPKTSSLADVLLSQTKFDFIHGVEFSVPNVTQVECEPFVGSNEICLYQADFGRSIDVPGGTNWIQLFGMSSGLGGDLIWSHAKGPYVSETWSLDLTTGAIVPYPDALAFSVLGTPTGPPIPEPGSMVLFGTGVLGVAGVLRRKLGL